MTKEKFCAVPEYILTLISPQHHSFLVSRHEYFLSLQIFLKLRENHEL